MTIDEHFQKMEALLAVLAERPQIRDWYTTEQFAHLIGRAEFTVREMCRHGRIRAEKMLSGRGAYPQWAISHAGILAIPKRRACYPDRNNMPRPMTA